MSDLHSVAGGRMRSLTVGAVALALLCGGIKESAARVGFLSMTLPVLAVLSGELFTGKAIGYLDGTGTLEIQSVSTPRLRCSGDFRHTGKKKGIAQVDCSDGTHVQLSFKNLSRLSGYGRGSAPNGPVSFTFGLTAEEAASYLRVPEGKRLEQTPEGMRLVDG